MRRARIGTDIVQMLLVMIALIVLLYLFFAFFVMEDVNKLEKLKGKYKLQQTVTSYMQQNNRDLQKSVANLDETIAYMNKPIDKEKLLELFSQFLHNVSIIKIEEKKSKDIIVTTYYVEGVLSSMHSFYDLIESLEQKRVPVRIDYPITFKRLSNREIGITLFLTLYQARSYQ